MNAIPSFLRAKARDPIITWIFVGLSFCALTQVGCNKEELAAQPIEQPPKPNVENQQQSDENASSEKATLQKAAELLEKAKSTGGGSAQQATKWMQEFLGDAAESGGATAQDTMQWTNEMYQSLKDQGLTTAGSATEWLSEDWNKMGAWQYKVIALDGLSPAEMESKLNELGAQRWECFHITSTENGQMMYFKKHARSYLKNVPLKDMMKLIPLLDSGNE